MMVTIEMGDVLKPWTKDFFYSRGLGEFWEMTVEIGRKVLAEEENDDQ